MSRDELNNIRKMTDISQLETLQRNSPLSTLRRAAEKRLKSLQTKPGRPLSNPEEGKLLPRSIWVSDPMWKQVEEYAESSHKKLGEAVRELLQKGLDIPRRRN